MHNEVIVRYSSTVVFELKSISRILVTKSESRQDPHKVKVYSLGAEMKGNFLKHELLFKEMKCLHTFLKNKMLLYVIYK